MKGSRFLIVPFLCLLFCGCTPEVRNVPQLLQQAEALLWEHPDSALQLLESVRHPERLKEEDCALHALLLSQARYRCYVPTTSDSLINIALQYYQAHPEDADRLASAWFYKAALSKDMGCPLETYFPAYKEAEALVPQITDKHLVARIYHALGMVNDDIFHNELAKKYYHKALKVNKTINDIESQCSNLTNLVGVYLLIEKKDSAQWCVEQLLDMASEIKDSVRLRDLYHSAGLCEEMLGNLTDAEKYYRNSLQYSRKKHYKTLSALAGLYVNIKQYDKADSLYHQIPEITDLATRTTICYDLYLMEKDKGNYSQAIKYIDDYVEMSSSYYTENNHQEIMELQHQYDLAVLKYKNSRIQLRWICAVAISLILIAILALYSKARKKKLLVEIVRLQNALWEKDSLATIYQEEIQALNQTLAERLKSEKELIGLKNRLLTILKNKEKESNTLERNAFNIISKLHQGECYSKDDREAIKYCLNLTHKGFTEKLDIACPNLQNRTKDICYLTALGFSLAEISQLLQLDEKTIKQYMGRVCKEAGLPECGKKQFYLFMASLLAPKA